jgi:hypothetical protein
VKISGNSELWPYCNHSATLSRKMSTDGGGREAMTGRRLLLLTVSVLSLNAALLSTASAETCVTGVNSTSTNAVSGITGQPGTTVVTGVTPTTASALTNVTANQGPAPFLTSAALSPVTGNALTNATLSPVTGNALTNVTLSPVTGTVVTAATTGTVTGITPPPAGRPTSWSLHLTPTCPPTALRNLLSLMAATRQMAAARLNWSIRAPPPPSSRC